MAPQGLTFLAAALAALTSTTEALLRFQCSQLVVERLDPLVFPGAAQSPHLHQIVGGNGFNITMDHSQHDISQISTCTTCTFSEDFSNYWTAALFFRARNGSYHRVPQRANLNFESARDGGMTVYYTPSFSNPPGKVTAFQPGFRMVVGNPFYRTREEASRYRQLTYTCLQDLSTRTGETTSMPTGPCPAGIMANIRFPTCWDGKNLDTPDHSSHVTYPASGTFESNGPCPSTHPVKIPQLFYEVIWDTRGFNDRSLWPEDGSQPFVWAYGDYTGYGNHGDYVFGWKGDSLQKAMDDPRCDVSGLNCNTLKVQSIAEGNRCTQAMKVPEKIDGWLSELPGAIEITGPQPGKGNGGGGGTTTTNPTATPTPTPGNGNGNGGGGCQVAKWGQCGGREYAGCTTCAAGSTCRVSNEWYSQCL